jgi:hypothetical protein
MEDLKLYIDSSHNVNSKAHSLCSTSMAREKPMKISLVNNESWKNNPFFFIQIKLNSLLFAKECSQTKQGLGLPQTYSAIEHAQ